MHRDRGGACVFDHPRERRRVALAVVPAGAHLHRNRDLHGFAHRRDHAGGVLRLAHEAAAGVVFGDLRHRASHVHVDDVGAHAFHDLSGVGHLFRIAAENLNGDRPLGLCVLGVLERTIDSANEPFRAHHLGDDQAAAAVSFHETAKRAVGHAGHWRDGERRR